MDLLAKSTRKGRLHVLCKKTFSEMLGIKYPIIGGAMYPCGNPELVAAVSAAGGIGIVQPISLTFVYKHGFRESLRFIRSLTPILSA
jgi:nitronate monooxygenase